MKNKEVKLVTIILDSIQKQAIFPIFFMTHFNQSFTEIKTTLKVFRDRNGTSTNVGPVQTLDQYKRWTSTNVEPVQTTD